MTNPFEILIGLDISESEHVNFQKKLTSLKKKLHPVAIELNITNKNIQDLKTKVQAGLNLTPVAIKVTADTKDLDALSSKAKKAGEGVNKALGESATGAKKASKEIRAIGNDLGVFEGNAASIKAQIKKQMNDAKKQFAFGINEIEADLKKRKLGYTIEQKVNADTRAIEAVVVKVQESANKIRQIKFEPFSAGMANNSNYKIGGWMESEIKVVNTEMKSLSDNVSKTRRELLNARDAGTITTEQFDKMNKSLAKITQNSHLDKLNKEFKDITTNTQLSNNELDRGTKLFHMREDALSRLTAASKKYSKHIDQEGLSNLKTSYKSIKFDPSTVTSAKAGEDAVRRLNNEMKKYIANATQASRESLTIMDSFKIAMERFPIWMAASTAFYGTIRTAREFMTIIIDIDTKMTELAKVMSEDTDFEALFERATQSAEKFGQSISQVMDSYAEFARQGYKGDELGTLADSGLVAANVGDMTAQKSSEYMTASLIQWKKDAKDSMSIIDSWNEISNNYATTTEKLAQGQARAGATARAMGLDFDQVNAIIGTVTASTKQSGNEIGNFLKNVLPKLVSDKSQGVLSSLGISLFDENENMRDVVQVYTEVAQALKGVSDEERILAVEGLAGKYHISRMQAFLDDLGSADSMYKSMYDSSVNSTGSAMEENKRYMESLQARLNLARVEVEKLALALGNAFLTEGMIQSIQLFGNFLGAITKVIEGIGGLPFVLGTASVALALVSTRFRGLMVSMGTGIAKTSAQFVQLGVSATKSMLKPTPPIIAQTKAINALSASTVRATFGFGTMSAATAVTSNATRTLAASTTVATVSTAQLSKGLKASALSAMASAKAFWTANRTMILSLGGIGVAFLAIGAITEAFMSKMQKQREIQEEITAQNQLLADSYTSNADRIGILAQRYSELQGSMQEIGSPEYNNEDAQEYLSVQNELAELIPSLSRGEDEYGNAILGSATVIERKIEMLKLQAEAQERVNKAEDHQKQKETYETAIESSKAAQKELDKFKFVTNPSITWDKGSNKSNPDTSVENEVKDINTLMAAIEELTTRKQTLSSEDAKGNKLRIDIIDGEIAKYTEQLTSYNNLVTGQENANGQLLNASLKRMDTILSANKGINSSAKSAVDAFATNAAYTIKDTGKLTNVFEDLYSTLENPTAVKGLEDFGKAFDTLKEKQSEGLSTEDLKIYSDEVIKQKGIIEKEFLAIATAAGIKKGTTEYAELKASFDAMNPSLQQYSMSVEDLAKKYGKTKEEMIALLAEANSLGDGMGDLDSAINESSNGIAELVAEMQKLNSASEKLAGVSQKQVDEVEDLIYIYQSLSKQTNRTAEQTDLLTETQATLAKIYPHLSSESGIRINDIIKERDAQDILLRAVEASKDGQLNAEEDATVGHLIETNARITNINTEIAALDKLVAAYNSISNTAQKAYDAAVASGVQEDIDSAARALMRYTSLGARETEKLTSKQAELATLTKSHGKYTSALSGSLDVLANSTKDNTSATKDSAEAMEKSTYIADKYGMAIDEVNAKIEEQNRIQSNFPDYSAQYKKSLQDELALQNKKKLLLSDQSKELEKQIKSGKILQTGVVTGSSNTSGSSAYTGKYATEINKASSTYGVDAHLIAAIIKAESSFNKDAKSSKGAQGLMQLMPATAKELGVKNAFDAQQNIMGGTKYIAQQIAKFSGDIKKALYAYNAGAGNVTKIVESSANYWTGAKNYANKIMADFEASGGSNITSGKQISGWGGTITSGFGKRVHPITGKYTDHNGIDIAGNKGDRLDANVSGKVTYAGKGTGSMSGFGNYVAVETADGLKHFYAHLDKVIAKVGETVAVGQQIGNIGSTGNSTGNHLHYQINENGKAINPSSYLATAKKTVPSASDASKDAANAMAAIDAAKSELLKMNSDIAAVEEYIENLKMELISADVAAFEHARKNAQHNIDDEVQKRSKLDSITKRYHDSIKNEIRLKGVQAQSYKSEVSYLNGVIKSGNLTAKAKAELTEKVKELSLSIVDLEINMKELTFERIQATMRRFSEEIDDTNFELQRSQAIMATLEESSPEYVAELNSQVETYKKLKEQNIAYRESLQRSLVLHDLLSEDYKNLTEEIEDLTLEIWGFDGSIKTLNETIKDSSTKNASEAADALIDAYKEYLSEKQEMHMESLDKEIDAEEERHKKVMKNYEDEYGAFERIVQAKLKEIDREESENNYDKDIDKLEEERNKISNKINLLSMDDSFESKAERKKLQEELDAIDESIADKRHDREIDLRKENLNDLLEKEKEKYEELEELEDIKYENEIERLEDLKKYWDKFYEDQLNDERYFAKMKEDIVAGNFKNLSGEFQTYIKEMEDTMPNFLSKFDGTLKGVGKSIRENVIDNLQKALDMLDKVIKTDSDSSKGIGEGAHFDGEKGNIGLSNADLKVLTGKYLAETLITKEKSAVRQTYIRDKAYALAAEGRAEKSTIKSNQGLDEILSKMSNEDKVKFGQYLQNQGFKTVSTDYLQDYITEYGKRLEYSAVGLKTGGYTKSDGLTMLHEEEVVLNKKETKDFFKYAPILETLNNMISPLLMPNIVQPSLIGNTSNNNNSPIKIDFIVENMNATKEEAKNFVNDIMTGLKRERGY